MSVLFADIVGFTPFAEEQDPERVRETLTRYFDVARTVIERHGGTVEKFIGDAVMAVWGTPVAREDDAERAVRAALELLPAVKSVDARLDARAGVLSGEAAVSPAASEHGLLAGDLVNTAARLQSVASPGTVLVGESTMRAAEKAVAFEPAGQQALKGKSAPVPAWRALRVVAERGGRTRPDTLEPPFVGRDAELALLKDLLHATTGESRARLIAVTGPAGIGKSRLAWELEKYLDGLVEPIYWHRGRSPSYGEGITFWALGEMVRRRCGLAEADDDGTTRARVAETVAEFVASDEDRRWVEPALLALLGVEEPPAGGREVLFAAWRIFFERIAERGTTVLLFEDLHFADSGLLDFIDHLLEWSRGAPLVVLALARPELVERRPGLGSATRHFHSLPLEPLPGDAMHELLAGLVTDLPHEAAAAIVARADGIPLYAVETVRMLIAEGRLELTAEGAWRAVGRLEKLAIPDTLRSLIASRLDSLKPAERDVLQQAAVLGQSFTLGSLAAVMGVDPDQLTGYLRSLVRREILALQADPRSPERGQYGFVQGLIREVAYGTLARRERRGRHLAAARYYESLGDEEVAGALADHYVSAYHASEEGAEADAVAVQARLTLRAAAERASALGAHEQAVAYLEQALAVTTEPADQADLLERLAGDANAAGVYADAERHARAAIDIYRQQEDRIAAQRTAARLGTILINASRLADAVVTFSEAIDELRGDALSITAELESGLARAYMRLNRHPEAIAAADRALVIAEPLALASIVAEALNSKGSALGFVDRWREGEALTQAAARIGREIGVPTIELRALNNLAVIVSFHRPGHARALYEEALELAKRIGEAGYTNFLTPNLAWQYFFAGRDWDTAIALLRERFDAARSPADKGRQLATELSIRSFRGDMAAEEIDRLEALFEGTDDPNVKAQISVIRAHHAFVQGRPREAIEHALRARRFDDSHFGALIWAARSALWLGDRAAAEEVAAHAEQRIGSEVGVPGAIRMGCRAAALALAGADQEALDAFRSCIAEWRRTGNETGVALTILDAVRALPGRPEPGGWVDEARSLFERVHAAPLLRLLDEALSSRREAEQGAAMRASPDASRVITP